MKRDENWRLAYNVLAFLFHSFHFFSSVFVRVCVFGFCFDLLHPNEATWIQWCRLYGCMSSILTCSSIGNVYRAVTKNSTLIHFIVFEPKWKQNRSIKSIDGIQCMPYPLDFRIENNSIWLRLIRRVHLVHDHVSWYFQYTTLFIVITLSSKLYCVTTNYLDFNENIPIRNHNHTCNIDVICLAPLHCHKISFNRFSI